MVSSTLNLRTIISYVPFVGPVVALNNLRIYDRGFHHRSLEVVRRSLDADQFDIDADLLTMPAEEVIQSAKQKFEQRISSLLDCLAATKHGIASSLLTLTTLVSVIGIKTLLCSNIYLLVLSTYGLSTGKYVQDLITLKKTYQLCTDAKQALNQRIFFQ